MQGSDDKKSASWFDPHTAFLDLPVVRIVLITIAAAAALSFFAILWNGKYNFSFDSEGFNNAVTLFKFPIGLLTISIPALALLAANHRSEQTKRQMALTLNQIERSDSQIEISHSQNRFSNYFKHHEEFDKRFKKNTESPPFAWSTSHLYGLIFPEARKGNLQLSLQAKDDLEECATTFIECCRDFMGSDWLTPMGRLQETMFDFLDKYRIAGTITNGSRYGTSTETFMISSNGLQGTIQHFIAVFSFVDDVFSFDENYETSEKIKYLFRINTALIPAMPPNHPEFGPFDIDKFVRPRPIVFQQAR
jgi:hypothetical protein